MENIFKINDGVLTRCQVNNPHVVVPEGVRVIAYSAFKKEGSYEGVDELKSVELPKSVEVIEHEAFQYCENLRRVVILGPAEIGYGAFKSCHHLTEVFLEDGVKSIGGGCFDFCSELYTLYIPASVTRVGNRLAEMNSGFEGALHIYCHAFGPGEGWDKKWDVLYVDPRFNDEYHTYRYDVRYGVTRDLMPRKEERTLIKDMPHGTGQQVEPDSREGLPVPEMRFKLWLTATREWPKNSHQEWSLTDEERQMLSAVLRKENDSPMRPLDTPWEVTVNGETGYLDRDLALKAWMNVYGDYFDGETINIHHDMPSHTDPYERYPISRLRKGETVIAEQIFVRFYDVRLHIQWVE